MKWVCSICGYTTEGEKAPATCPICRAPAEVFERADLQKESPKEEPKEPPKQRVCSVCGYISEGAKAPERCPVCNAPAQVFI